MRVDDPESRKPEESSIYSETEAFASEAVTGDSETLPEYIIVIKKGCDQRSLAVTHKIPHTISMIKDIRISRKVILK